MAQTTKTNTSAGNTTAEYNAGNVKNIIIAGVGGQGTLLASRILGGALLSCGYDVKVSEVHGMSQRGGSVVTYVRFGKKVYSPVICRGEADLIISFEQLEAARWLPYLKKEGMLITGVQKINPMPVVSGTIRYPEGITDKIKTAGVNLIAVDALTLARQAGNERSVNIVLIGVMAKHIGREIFGGDIDIVEKIIAESVPQKYLEVNLKAYNLGRESV